MEIPINRAQDSQMVSNLSTVSDRILASFPWAITHDTFPLTALIETNGCFQALAKVSLAPNSMKCINFRLHSEIFGICEFSSATSENLGISHPVNLRMRLKILLQKDLILGHSYHMWANVPKIWHPLKQGDQLSDKLLLVWRRSCTT